MAIFIDMFAKENNLRFQERRYEIVTQITNGRGAQSFKLNSMKAAQNSEHNLGQVLGIIKIRFGVHMLLMVGGCSSP